MKIEIDIDVAAMVRDAIYKHIQENLIINNVPEALQDAVVASTQNNVVITLNGSEVPQDEVQWEYAPKLGKRRSKLEQELHKHEIKYNRILTTDEVAEVQAQMEISQEKVAKTVETIKNQERIKEMAEEGTVAAKEELAEEAKQEPVEMTTTDLDADLKAASTEPTIPQTEELPNLNSLFS